MKRAAFILAALLLSLIPRSAHACAGCSNPNLPSGRNGAMLLQPWQLSAALNATATTMQVVHSEYCPDIGPICQARDEPPQLHDQRFYVGELRPILELGLTRVLGVELQLPFRVTNTGITFRRLDRTAFTPDYENIHHRNETLAGLGDPSLSGRAAWSWGKTLLSARAGVTLPIGRTEEDPFARGRAGLPHQHIQYGTGTVNPLLALDVGTTLGRFYVSGYGQAFLALYENGHGYRAGNRYLGGVSVETELVAKLRLGLGADLLNEQPERWQGEIQQDGNVGRTDLLVGGTVSYAFGPVTALLSVKAPVWQQFITTAHAHDEEPGQLRYPVILNLGLQHTFDLAEASRAN